MISRTSETGAESLLSARAVRATAQRMLALALDGSLDEWTVDLDRLPATADFVARVTRESYPSLDVPMHSRWRHFVFSGRDFWKELAVRGRPRAVGDSGVPRDDRGGGDLSALGPGGSHFAGSAAGAWSDAAARARAAFDLAITSVLLDAGAGSAWRYRDAVTGIVAARSEGLALASFRWFESGGFSADLRDPLRVDGSALVRVDADALNAAFQVSDVNPLLGADSRASLLNRLGAAVQARPDLFALEDSPRPGGLFDALVPRADSRQQGAARSQASDSRTQGAARVQASADFLPARGSQPAPAVTHPTLPAAAILETLLDAFGSIWTNRPSLGGVALGDCWPHPALATGSARMRSSAPADTAPGTADALPADSYVPLHKLSQWLAYSLIEPLQDAGITVTGVDELTGLPEYRNGGLLIDMGVLLPRDPASFASTHAVSSPFVVAMRALTVALLDRLAPLVGERLGLAKDQYLLARVLEGGTWSAGRRVARERRADGGPPFQISSDGTVL